MPADLHLKILYDWGSHGVNKKIAVSWVSSVFMLALLR